MLQNNPEIELIVNAATEYAIELHHKYVTVEHIAYALLKFEKFNNLLYTVGVDVEELLTEFEHYLETGLNSIVSGDFSTMPVPGKTHGLERVFNRAYTQVLFSNRDNITPVDLYLSITAETQSYAAYFFIKYGLEKDRLINEHNKKERKTGKPRQDSMNTQQAIKVLEEHCTNLNHAAEDEEIDTVIGRDPELEEIAQILARRNKCNVLMVGDPGVGKTAIAE